MIHKLIGPGGDTWDRAQRGGLQQEIGETFSK